MTCQCRSRSRTLAASRTHRLGSHAQGHSGSNQKSTRAVVGALCTASVIDASSACPSTRPVAPGLLLLPIPIAAGLFPSEEKAIPVEHPDGPDVHAWKASGRVRTESDPHR